ncbi:MAG: hypothetical protein GTO18_03555 [Anaerolineales bacterium]|nr:hypothetical protein [Anaerolineales bacterium]
MKITRLTIFIAVGVLLLAACDRGGKTTVDLAPKDKLSPEVQQAPISVQEAYRFALANPELLQQIPCYCGCGGVGHTTNYACYVSSIGTDGSVDFDYHALG